MRTWVFIGLLLVTTALKAMTDFEREQIQQRIHPIGRVRVKEQMHSVSQQQTDNISFKSEAGERIYEHYCGVCHGNGVAGAPKFRSRSNWLPRLSKKSISGLTSSAIKGLNVMPPRGTCYECSEDDIKAAIEYMVPQS